MLNLIFKLAFRNVLKYRKRTAVILLVIAISVFCTQFTFSFMDGFMGNMLTQMFDNSGHAVFTRQGYQEKAKLYPLDYTIENADEISARLEELEGISSVRSLITFGALGEGKEYSIPLVCMGISIGDDPTANRYRDNIVSGSMITPDDDGVLIGDELAETLGKKVGDSIMLIVQDFYGSPNPVELTVRGICDTHIKLEKSQMVVMPVSAAALTLNLPGDALILQINLEDRARIKELEPQLLAIAAEYDLEVETYLEKFNAWLSMIEQSKIFSNFIYMLIIMIAATTIINTVLTSVFERFRDFGTLRSIGLPKSGLFAVILIEAAFNSILGIILANCITVPFIYYYSVNGIDFGSALDTMDGLSRVFYIGFSFRIFFIGSIIGLLAGIVSAVYPAIIAVRKSVVDALRYV